MSYNCIYYNILLYIYLYLSLACVVCVCIKEKSFIVDKKNIHIYVGT